MTRHIAVVMTPTSNEFARMIRLLLSVKKSAKLSRVRLLSASRNALTRIITSGITTNRSINSTYG